MKYRRLSLICLLAAFLVVALSANAFADAIDRDTPFGVNENGETYGNYFQSMEAGIDPDLIYAQGENGILGYVRASDLEEPLPESPEAALALQAERQASGYTGHYINLYNSDGVTIIGRYWVDAGTSGNNSISTRSFITYSAFSELSSINYDFRARSFVQRATHGVTYGAEIYSSEMMQAGELAVKVHLYNFDTGALVNSPIYMYSTVPGDEYSYSALYRTSSGVYYSKGFARGFDREEGVWGTFGLRPTGNCQII